MTMDDDELRQIFGRTAQHPVTLPPELLRSVRVTDSRKPVLLGLAAAATIAAIALAAAWPFGTNQSDVVPTAMTERSLFLQHREMGAKPYAGIAPGTPLDREHDCLMIHGDPIVWPMDATWDGERQTVSLERDGQHLTISVNHAFPPGLSGGLLPMEALAHIVDRQTLAFAKQCVEVSQSEGQTSNDVWVVN